MPARTNADEPMSDQPRPPRHDLRWLADAEPPNAPSAGAPAGPPNAPPAWGAPLSTAPPQGGWSAPTDPFGRPVQPGPPMYPGAAIPPAPGSATTALVLGILGIVLCPLLLSIPAWIVGAQARREARALPGQPGYGNANAGFILGIVGTVIWGLIIALYVVILLGLFAAAESWDDYARVVLPGAGA